ncbi:peroxisome biogenesis factor 10-like [Dermatophagoides pteronyssinus]|uniref:peroxisome biogenesis factor 10-like n=1 Tax=Dermatophagoides pteronyssinus TaxID=6956 RepID=UPI003F6648BD
MTQNQNNDSKLKQFQPNITQIIRSEHKDNVYIKSILQSESNSICKQFLPTRQWIQYQSYIDDITKFIYYLLTTVSGRQTLGEEYGHIICIDHRYRSIPSIWKRLSLAALYSFPKRLLNFATKIMIKNDDDNDDDDSRMMIEENLQFLIESIGNINLAIFFIQNRYPDFLKRCLSIGYLSTTATSKSSPTTDSNQLSLKILSILTIIPVILSFYSKFIRTILINRRKKHSNNKKHSINTIDKQSINETKVMDDNRTQRKCPLCFQSLYQQQRNPTLLFCGHIFCWNCLSDWLMMIRTSSERKDECPLCKMKIFDTKQFVLLHNL